MEKTNNSLLQRCFLGIVSSLLLDEDILFIGKGNSISIYNTLNDKLITHKQIFDANKITNIKIITLNLGKKILFAVAEKEIQYTFYDKKNIVDSLQFNKFNTLTGEFCLDICLMNEYLCFGFMNNFIEIHEIVNMKDNMIQPKHIKTMFCNEKSIVYSLAIISKEKDESIIIASGTVFRRIVLWEVLLKDKDDIKINKTLALTGHGGVIFSVRFVDNIPNTLLSTSDDRTAMIWEYDLEKESFKSDIYYGHSARVWNAVCNSEKSLFVSVGEDTTARIYNINTKQFVLELTSGHHGKNIRSAVMNSEFIWTGAEDGQVIKWNYAQILSSQSSSQHKESDSSPLIAFKLNSNDLQCTQAKIKQHNFSPSIKIIYLLNEGNILIGTNHGYVLNYSIDKKIITQVIYVDSETRVINAIDVISKQFVLTGLSDGKVNLTDLSDLTIQKTMDIFKNIRIPFIKHKIFPHSKDFFLIISTAIGKNMIIYYHDYTKLTLTILQELLSQKNPLVLNTGARFPKGISSMEIIYISKGHFNIFLGDYEGRIYFTSIQVISNNPFCFDAVKYLTIHNNDKITCIFYIKEEKILYTLSRDGFIKKFCLIINHGSYTIKELDAQCKKDMHSYEKILWEKEEDFYIGKYYLIGHTGRKLLLYDNEKNIIIHANDVKGVQRPLDCMLYNGSLIYAYSQSDCMFLKSISIHSINSNTNNQNSIHSYSIPLNGRLIHFTNVIHLINDIYLLTTSAEDTKVNFYLMSSTTFFRDSNDLIFLNQFVKHNCSIRKTKLVFKQFTTGNEVAELVFISIASKSEALLFKIIINLINKASSFNFLCDLSMPFELNDTRNMDVVIHHFKQDNRTLIAFTNTIGIIWCYVFDLSKTMFNYEEKKSIVNNKTNFIGLSLNTICPDNTDSTLTFINGLTNGNLNLITYSHPDKVNLFYKIHEAGINDIKVFKNNIIISCGEDYSIIISQLINLTELKVINKIQKFHFSAIKTIELILINEEQFSIVSGSYDQLINIIEYNTINKTCTLKRKVKACVAEINSIGVSTANDKEIIFVAAGQGIEVFRYLNI